jgi:LMBR1 domain-containing protein 1
MLSLDDARQANNGGDIDCNGSSCGGLDMSTFWVVFFCMIAVFVSIIIPFCIFYYEADDGISIGYVGTTFV